MIISSNIKILRVYKGISCLTLSKMINVSEATINRWETGSYEPKIKYIHKLSKALDVDIDFFYYPITLIIQK
jgi:DNA-binding XRE family transcriptional regulator